ncbi:dipicolinate synthase subunit B [Desulfuribacillus stibiiarsenatis]|uniref:Dipicolinate synthase subunit B n=1 Tax=Desulfuribacillus stibiiarsenatis TaxID=1390249 RepID=A0A1E5L6T8_9FIRM|nr:dipicolinate synthase subunit B [Desulfuribacillus stibiiarsenatis]OEH85870.1 dipicolinate synthase subunit B [Desulfuribacillus stibiiarsenatis]
MKFAGKTIGFALTGSHCTFAQIMPIIQNLVDEGARIIPIISESVKNTDTRFGKSKDWISQVESITNEKCISTIVGAEPIGPKKILDGLVIAPCTGNTISKLANAITDSPVLMAAKAHLRNQKPLIIAVSTNDGLGLNGANIGRICAIKNIFMVPFGQDDPINKANSLVADMEQIAQTIELALEYKQIQPVIIEVFNKNKSQ